jgi:hypothetical protein
MKTKVLRLAMAVASAAAVALPASAQEAFEWTGRLAAGQTLDVRGISGDVVATLASGGEARVVATKSGRESDFDAVSIEVFEEGDAVVVCAVYGARGRATSCDGDDWDDDREHHRDIRVSVDFEVRVPAGVTFSGSTVSGDVEAEGLRSDVEASTVSGSVYVSTSGVAMGRTVSGDVEVDMGSLDWRSLDFRTVSGDITVRLPGDLGADVEFEYLSGDFSTDFDMARERVKERWVGSEVRGTIGDGGRSLTFETVSGDVKLHSRRPGR